MIRTLLPIAFGGIAGLISFALTANAPKRDPLGIIVLVFMIYVHKFILPRFDKKPEGKDWAAISFLSFASWYVVWTFLLNL